MWCMLCYVCMHVCTHACMNGCMHVHMHECMYGWMDGCTYCRGNKQSTEYESFQIVCLTWIMLSRSVSLAAASTRSFYTVRGQVNGKQEKYNQQQPTKQAINNSETSICSDNSRSLASLALSNPWISGPSETSNRPKEIHVCIADNSKVHFQCLHCSEQFAVSHRRYCSVECASVEKIIPDWFNAKSAAAFNSSALVSSSSYKCAGAVRLSCRRLSYCLSMRTSHATITSVF